MPLVACPKCASRLQVPDGPAAGVRCPKCQTIFQPPKMTQPAFEVVDEPPPAKPAPAKLPPPKPTAAKPVPAKPAPVKPAPSRQPPAVPPPPRSAAPAIEELEFEVVDGDPAPPKKTTGRPGNEDDRPRRREIDDDDRPRRRRDDEDDLRPVSRRSLDDDDDRPRKRREYDDDDDDRPRPRREYHDDDRPRGRGARDDDDDDRHRPRREYDDDRPRGRRDRDDDDRRGRSRRRSWDDDRPAADRRAPYRRGKIAALLLAISLWLYLGAFGMTALLILVGWLGAKLSADLAILPGLLGLGNWLVAAVGLGFSIAGPARARGMAIAATSVAGVHLILALVCFAKVTNGPLGFGGPFGASSGLGWGLLVSLLPVLDITPPLLIYASSGFGDLVVAVLAGACEVARLILVLLTLKAFAEAAGDRHAADRSRVGAVITSSVMGGVVVFVLLVAVLAREGGFSPRTVFNVGAGAVLLVYLSYALMLFLPAMAAHETKAALDDRC